MKYTFDKFNSFHKNLKFKMERFEDKNMHFLDTTINIDTDLYYKPTHTGKYSDFTCIFFWNYKTLWIKSLYYCARKIFLLAEKFKSKICKINFFISRNKYPLHARNSFIKQLINDTKAKGKDKKPMKRKLSGLHYLILDI